MKYGKEIQLAKVLVMSALVLILAVQITSDEKRYITLC